MVDKESSMLTFQQPTGLQSSEDSGADKRLGRRNRAIVTAHVKLLNGSVNFLGSEETTLPEALDEL
jgi:hypothetical protein